MLEKYGSPEEGVRCSDGPDVGAAGAGEVVFDVLAFPINPRTSLKGLGADVCAGGGPDRYTRSGRQP